MAQRISAATRERIVQAANRMGYRPNLLARSLRTRRSNTIALLVSDIANPWFGQLASLIEQTLHRQGYSMIVCNSGEDLEREQEYLRLLPQKGIDGLILVPLIRSKKTLQEYIPSGLPVVIVDRPIPGMDASVSSDPDRLAGALCDTLERAGVKKVALVTGPMNVLTHRQRAEIIESRFTVVDKMEGPAQKDTGHAALIRFMNLRHQPDAIVCTNNFLCQGILEGIGKIERPPIMAVFDDISMMHLLTVPMVASLQDVPMLADAAVQQLMPQLSGSTQTLQPILLPARVVVNDAFRKRAEGK
jgi:LacI family transcriptional regulator